jgi:hypothetical protein
MKKKRITVASAKSKGRRLQQWVCKQIAELTGFEWGADCPIESRGMGQNGVDVRLEKDVIKVFPYSVECKAQESWSIPAWIEQAKANIMPGTEWLLVAKKSRQDPIVIIDAKVFFQILQKVKEE